MAKLKKEHIKMKWERGRQLDSLKNKRLGSQMNCADTADMVINMGWRS